MEGGGRPVTAPAPAPAAGDSMWEGMTLSSPSSPGSATSPRGSTPQAKASPPAVADLLSMFPPAPPAPA
eukprot:COSAG04_NODE_505_length_13342_cov_2.786529_1_plen_68_part_10